MNLYVGDYWATFPHSEYGGLWVVTANDTQECVDLLKNDLYSQYDEESDIVKSVNNAQCFQLKDDNIESRIVEAFFT